MPNWPKKTAETMPMMISSPYPQICGGKTINQISGDGEDMSTFGTRVVQLLDNWRADNF
jgi:hypothetical protein